ncbi:MAG TPA: transaldolase, partial [bacterium]|nr:transaldolase [bacterium]
AAVANSKIIFNEYKETFHGAEFMTLKAKGANMQRLLFASTSTKDPSYYDLKYVEPLIGRNTVSTLPDETIEHIADHGRLSPDTASQELENSNKIIAELSELGIDLDEVGEKLQEDGVKSFENSYDKLLDSIKNISRNI